MRAKYLLTIAGALFAFTLASPQTAGAATIYSFGCITDSSSPGLDPNCTTGQNQFKVTVDDAGSDASGNYVSFKFTNAVGSESSITDIYFDDGTLLGIASITNGSNVNFSQLADPAELPGNTNVTPNFQTTAGFSADSQSEPTGVDAANESVTITFLLINGKTFADTLAALNGGVDLRIGIQGIFGNNLSSPAESFINLQQGQNVVPAAVPEPASLLMLGSGLLGGAWRMRAQRRAKQRS